MTATALIEMRRARRSRRIANIHWIDAIYNVYLAGVIGALATGILSEQIGDTLLSNAQMATVRAHGPAACGLLLAVSAAIGLRSGSRGGPFGLEPAEARHALLAPISRASVLRGPALKQARFLVLIGGLTGLVAGRLGAQRLPGGILKWMVAGAGFGATTAIMMVAVAWFAGGMRLNRAVATGAAGVLVAWAVADIAGKFITAPTSFVGHVALWPLQWHNGVAIGLVATIAIGAFGLSRLGQYSIENLERRSGLVDQIRFAATMQDVRTFMLLRRQLSQEQHRNRPLIGPRRRTRRPINTTWRRDWNGYLRWPLSRVVRIMAFGIIAALALRGVWLGTTPLVVVAGVALYLAGLDVLEPMAQETDHPDRRDQFPFDNGTIYLRHLPASFGLMFLICAVSAGVVYATNPSTLTIKLASVLAVTCTASAVSAATTSVVSGAPQTSRQSDQLIPPEIAGMRVLMRNVWPFLVATSGALPIVFARRAFDRGDDPITGMGVLIVVVGFVALFTASWVRFREGAKAWFHASLEQAAQQGKKI